MNGEPQFEYFRDDEGDCIVKLRIDGWHLTHHGKTYKSALSGLAEMILMCAKDEGVQAHD